MAIYGRKIKEGNKRGYVGRTKQRSFNATQKAIFCFKTVPDMQKIE
jgi:hypothetical protein